MLLLILTCAIIGSLGLTTPAAAADPPPAFAEQVRTHRITLLLREGDGTPVAARLSVSDPATGEPFWPTDASIPTYQAHTSHDYFYAENSVEVLVNEGWVRVLASRGPEYGVVDQSFYVSRAIIRALAFQRLFDPAAYDLYSGDVQVEINHGGEGDVYVITNEDLARAVRAEGLNVTCALTNGLYFNGGLDPAGDADHLIHFGMEYRSALYGHMGIIGLTTLLDSFGCCLPGYPAVPLNLEIQAQAHEQGAVVTYAHPVSVNPKYMSDTRLDWPYSGLAREVPVDVLIGEIDTYDLFSYSNSDVATSRDLWFDLLNLGRRLPLSVGTDAALNRYLDPPIGGYRLYVRTPGGLDFAAWLEGLRAGRSFATNGPLLMEFTIGGAAPGDTLHLPAEGDAPLAGHLLLQSRKPATRLDVYSNGDLVYTSPLPAYEGELEFPFSVSRPAHSGWLVARVTGPRGSEADVGDVLEAVTSPIRVSRGGAPMTPRTTAVHRFLAWIEELQDIVAARDGWESSGQMASVWNVLETARAMLAGPNPGSRVSPVLEHFEQPERTPLGLAVAADGRAFRAEGRGRGVLEVFDVQGRRVYVSAERPLPAVFRWRDDVEGRGLAAGFYFGRVRTDEDVSRTVRLRIIR